MSAYLGIDVGTDQEVLEPLLDEVTALFEKACGRESAPFGAAQTGRTEIIQGDPWSKLIYLDYPIATITSIGVGLDVAVPDEVMVPASAASVVWIAGRNDILRSDGGYWARYSPTLVKVVYNTQAYTPLDAKIAVKKRVAAMYGGRGKEGFTQISRGSRSWSMAMGSDEDQADRTWGEAVRNNSRGWLR
jgi:hypothetical protein